MEIFKIARQEGVTPQVIKGAVPEARHEEGYQLSEAEELKKAKELAGDAVAAPGADGKPNADGKQEEADLEGSFTLGNVKTGNVVVKIDGPLSQIFTSALNKVLAFENLTLLPILAAEYEEMKKDQDFNDITKIHVQAYDANDLSTNDVTDIADGVTETIGDMQIIAMETHRNQRFNDATGKLERYCHSVKARTCYKLAVAAERIRSIAVSKGV